MLARAAEGRCLNPSLPDLKADSVIRYFLTYKGVSLPLQLTQELQADELRNRNTYFEAHYDAQGRITAIDKKVYGEVEMTHRYVWDAASGQLAQATVQIGDDEAQTLSYAV